LIFKKVHRVIQLVFCDIYDIGKVAFKITNPQKVVTFFTKNSSSKKEWMRVIYEAMKVAKAHRQEMISGR